MSGLRAGGCGDHPCRGCWRQHGIAVRDGPHRVENPRRWGVFEDEPECSGVQCAEYQIVGVECGQNEHPRRRGPSEEFPGRAETVAAGHPHVHQNDVRPLLVHHGDRGVPVGRFRDDGQVRFTVDDEPQRHPHQLVVVDDDDAHRLPLGIHSCSLFVGGVRPG